jgi:hypothetical protein
VVAPAREIVIYCVLLLLLGPSTALADSVDEWKRKVDEWKRRGSGPVQPSGRTCTRGEPVTVHKGSAIAVTGTSLSYTDPQSRVSNTIQWNLPPPTLTIGQEVTLVSWSTHNRGAPVEVHWETGGRRDHGADSEINEANKQSKLKFTGGAIELRGGIRNTRWDGPGHFTMRWPYTCALPRGA